MTDIELENGYKLTYENATNLIKEADLLFQNIFLPRAYTLYQFAIEEIGKCSILYKAIIEYNWGVPINFDYLKQKGFTDHKSKTKDSLHTELFAIQMFEKHIGAESSLKESIYWDYDNVNLINDKKNNSLYVGLSDQKFLSPNQAISYKDVAEIQYKAKIRLKTSENHLRPLEEMKEIALQLKEILEDPEKAKEFESKLNL